MKGQGEKGKSKIKRQSRILQWKTRPLFFSTFRTTLLFSVNEWQTWFFPPSTIIGIHLLFYLVFFLFFFFCHRTIFVAVPTTFAVSCFQLSREITDDYRYDSVHNWISKALEANRRQQKIIILLFLTLLFILQFITIIHSTIFLNSLYKYYVFKFSFYFLFMNQQIVYVIYNYIKNKTWRNNYFYSSILLLLYLQNRSRLVW